MRNLTIINQQYPPEVASTGQIFHAMAVYLQSHGFDVTVVTGTPYYPGLTDKPPKRERQEGVRIRRLANTTFSKKSMLGKFMNLLTFEISLFFYCIFRISRKDTVLVATAPPMAVVCSAIGRFFRRYPVVMTVQDLYPDVLAASGMSGPQKLSYRLLHRIMRRSMHTCREVIAISSDMQRHLESAYGLRDVLLIPNLFPETIHPIDPADNKKARGWTDKLIVQYSGNFGIAHEYTTLLETVRLLGGHDDILFQIAGAGKHYDILKGICEAEALPNIVFEGYAPADQLESHLGLADISVVIFSEAFQSILLPSKYYGILASGRGVLLISGDENDISRDIRSQRIGLTFAHGDSQGLADALRSLREDPSQLQSMGARARALYDARYAMPIVLGEYQHVLETVTDG